MYQITISKQILCIIYNTMIQLIYGKRIRIGTI